MTLYRYMVYKKVFEQCADLKKKILRDSNFGLNSWDSLIVKILLSNIVINNYKYYWWFLLVYIITNNMKLLIFGFISIK